MSAESRICVGCASIGVPCTSQNRRYLDSTLKSLLLKSKALQLLEAVRICGAVHGSVAKDHIAYTRVINCRKRRSLPTGTSSCTGAAATADFRGSLVKSSFILE